MAIRTALTIARPQNCRRNAPPNLLAHYPYLWEPTVVRQAIETAWISPSSGGHSLSYWLKLPPNNRTGSTDRDGFLLDDELRAAGHRVALGVLRHCGAHSRSMFRVVVGIDVDDLIERTEFGMPEGPQFGVFLPQREPLLIALFE